jgi:Development and cell death domain
MQTGYVFLCNRAVMSECARNRRLSCSGKQTKVAQELKPNTIIFLFNDATGTLLGPFTVAPGPEDLVKGAWYSSVNRESFSGNIRIDWEELHELKNAPEKIPLLRNTNECALSVLQTQELLTELKKAPSYSDEKQ